MNGIFRLFTVLLLGIVVAGMVIVSLGILFLISPASSSSEEIVFEVRPAESLKSVARRLESEGLISNARYLEIYARLTNRAGKIRTGEYAIRKNSRPRHVLSVISSGQSVHYSITISEGLNRFEIAEIVSRQGIASSKEFLELSSNPGFIRELLGRDAESLEGYLFPDTYHVTKYTGAKELIKIMVGRFQESFGKIKNLSGWSSYDLDDHQVITLASIVEKETGAPEERPVIASVFHNRLRKKMRLQTDPTIIYGIWNEKGSWNGAISRADLKFPSRYNTYLHSGLPPGPIANPGFEALKAVGLPAVSDYLFFVSRNDGTHVFSKDYQQHKKAVERFQLDRRAREGKSWRDLQKRKSIPDRVHDKATDAKTGRK